MAKVICLSNWQEIIVYRDVETVLFSCLAIKMLIAGSFYTCSSCWCSRQNTALIVDSSMQDNATYCKAQRLQTHQLICFRAQQSFLLNWGCCLFYMVLYVYKRICLCLLGVYFEKDKHSSTNWSSKVWLITSTCEGVKLLMDEVCLLDNYFFLILYIHTNEARWTLDQPQCQ